MTSLRNLLALHDLEVFHARRIPTHGGSIRVYAARRGTHPVKDSVATFLAEERRSGAAGLHGLRSRVVASKLGLLALLDGVRRAGEHVVGIGAPSRASTLVSHVGLDEGILDAVLEVPGSHKIGKLMPGTLIPVEDEARLFADPPENALLLSWHIADELVPKLRSRGYQGRFIVPLPEPRFL